MALGFLVLGAAVGIAYARFADRPGAVFSVRLKTATGGELDLASLRGDPASVFAFLAPDCPLSQNYTLTLNQLREEFSSDGVAFFGVISGGWFSQSEIDEFVETYRTEFPILMDDDFVLANLFDAHVTPEVFAIDGTGEVRYKGAIDDWAGELGQHRTVITAHYLSDALGHIVVGESPEIAETIAIGCFLERL